MENKPPKIELKPEIYISYAWEKQEDGSNWPPILKNLYKILIDKGFTVHVDINSLKYKDNIKSFMQELGKGKYIISIISEKYMKSISCMYEVLQMLKHPNYKDRIFPILTSDAKIYNSKKILEYLIHWENEINNLNNEAKALSNIAYAAPIFEDVEIMNDIRRALAQFGNEIGNMNVLTHDEHEINNFENLIDCIELKVEIDRNTIDLKIENLSLKEENLKLNKENQKLKLKLLKFNEIKLVKDKNDLVVKKVKTEIPESKEPLKILEFKSFLGFSKENTIDDCIDILGQPNSFSNNDKYEFNTAYFDCNVDISFIKKTKKVMAIAFKSMKVNSIIAINLLKSKGINDSKIEYLGIHRDEILKIFGKPDSNNSDNYTYYVGGFVLVFICYEFNDYLCNAITVNYGYN